MSRVRLRSPDQPAPLRWLLGLYEFCASLKLAVIVIVAMIVTLTWATFVESYFGDKSRAAHFGIYGTWWFAGLNALLGLNVLCAALIRFPWKKYQTGFVITHAGILVLLAGCYLSYRGGIDAQMPIYEGQNSFRAYEQTQRLQLSIAARGESAGGQVQTVEIPFAAGPFDWSTYQDLAWHPLSDRHFWFPWALAHRDEGVVYDRDGVRLEVLDYYADSERLPIPRVTLRARPAGGGMAAATEAEEVTLVVRQDRGDPHMGGRPFGMGDRQELPRGQRVVFWMTADPDETKAFLATTPQGPLGRLGQIALSAKGQVFRFQVDGLEEGKRLPLGDTGLSVALASLRPEFPGVQLDVHRGNDPPEPLFLLADLPDFSRQDYRHGVFGAYWVDVSADGAAGDAPPSGMRQMAQNPRLDVLQGADRRLYFRAWHAPKLGALGRLPRDGGEVTVWRESGQPWTFSVGEFLPAEKPDRLMRPLPFAKAKSPNQKQQQVRLRLTVDGQREEFWLAGFQGDPDDPLFMPEQRHTVAGKGREVAVMMPRDSIDVGFRVHLHRFNRKLDPGTSQAAHYSSNVSFRDRADAEKKLQPDEPSEGVQITLNQPVNFSDPRTGRSYRLYQESFAGPFKPGDPEYDQIVGGRRLADQLFVSYLAVNYDPGRGLKYGGCLMIVAGIAVMFWMKAYFFPKRKPAGEQAPGADAPAEPRERRAAGEAPRYEEPSHAT